MLQTWILAKLPPGHIALNHKWIGKYKPNEAHPCKYFRRSGDEITTVIIYVDDGLIASNKPETIKAMIEHLERKFEIRTLTPTRFVGLNIVRDRPNRLMYIDQENTIDKMVKDYNMWDCIPS